MTDANEIRAGRHCVAKLHVQSAEGFNLQTSQQFERSLLKTLAKRVCGAEGSLLAWSTVVSQLLCRIVRWCTDFHHQAIPSTATNAVLTAGTVAPFIFALKGEALRRIW